MFHHCQILSIQPWDLSRGPGSSCAPLGGLIDVFRAVKAESEAQRGKPKGTPESEIRMAILLLGQRPPRYTGV